MPKRHHYSLPFRTFIRRCTLLLVSLLMAVSGSVWAGKLADYWMYDEYYAEHPEQQQASAELIAAVRNESVPVDTPHKKIKIGIIYPSIQYSGYWLRSVRSFALRMDELGINYELQTRYTKPFSEISKQLTQIEQMLEWKPDYLVYTLDSARQRAMVERLIRGTNIKLILQNITTPIKDWGSRQPFMYTGFDHAEGAKRLAQYFRQRMPRGTPYAVLFRNKGLVSEMRGLTFIREIGSYHKLRTSYYANSNREGGYKATLQILKETPNIKYIYACGTDTAIGALDALRETGRQDIIVNGWGGGSEEIQELVNGNLKVVLMRMNDANGISMAEAIKRDLEGKPVPLIFSGDFTILDESMSLDEIKRMESQAFQYSNKDL